jgi:hypothetical protein
MAYYIEGAAQELLYEGAGEILSIRLTTPGVEITSTTGDVELQVYDPDGTAIGSSVHMTHVGTTSEWTYTLDISATGTYPLGQDYRAEVTYVSGGVTYKQILWFDIVRYPFLPWPIVTSALIDRKHPDWLSSHPTSASSGTWFEPIISAHADLADRLRKMDRRASLIIKRQQLEKVELAFCERECALFCGFPNDEIKRFTSAAEDAWNGVGPFSYDADESGTIDTDTDSEGNEGPDSEVAVMPRRVRTR